MHGTLLSYFQESISRHGIIGCRTIALYFDGRIGLAKKNLPMESRYGEKSSQTYVQWDVIALPDVR
jgi:hypothetical protein